jgi:hypothetical protein
VAHKAMCEAKYGFAAASSSALAADDCPTTICGLNGAWLGRGVRFRTLHLDGTPNAQGLTIKEFRKDRRAMTLHVDGDDVSGVRPRMLRSGSERLVGRDLEGSELILEHKHMALHKHEGLAINPVTTTYTLKFLKYLEEDFKAQTATRAEPKVPLYKFEVTTGDGCKVELCKPGLSDGHADGITGTAVIFRGDLYNEETYEVSAVPPSPSGSGAIVNVACVDTAIAKLHMLRHTSASQISSAAAQLQPTVPQRQALLRLLTADYCGIGHPFTEDGLPIGLAFNSALYPVTDTSSDRTAVSSIDARWSESGATCIGSPRWLRGTRGWTESSLRTRIREVCGTRLISDCPDTATPAPGAFFTTGSYAISINPPPVVATSPTATPRR